MIIRFLTLIFFVILYLDLYGQNFEFSAQFYSESYGQKVVAMGSEKYLFAGKIFPGLWEDEKYTIVYGAIDTNGSLFPFAPIPDFDNSNVLDIHLKDNGHFLIAAENFECGEIESGVVYELDEEGEIVHVFNLNLDCWQYMDLQKFQNEYFVSCSAGISRLNDDGSITELINGSSGITGFVPLYNNWFLVGKTTPANGFQGVEKWNAAGQVLGSLNLPTLGPVKQFEAITFNKNIILQEQAVYIFDDNLQIIESLDLSGLDIELLQFDYDENEIWLLGQNAFNDIITYGLDHELNIIYDMYIDKPGLSAKDIVMDGDQIVLIGTGSGGIFEYTSGGSNEMIEAGKNFWMKSFPKTSSTTFLSTDISLDDMTMNVVHYVETNYTCEGNQLQTGLEVRMEDIQLKITNNSPEIIQSVVANTRVGGCPGSCDYDIETIITKEFTDLNLQPGASIWVSVPDFQPIFNESQQPKACFWLSAPNQHIDTDVTNNIQCLDLFPYVSTESIYFDKKLTISPNPVTDKLILSFDEKRLFSHSQLTIIDALGRPVLNQQTNKEQTSVEINVQSLQSGMYWLKIDGIAAGKFLKY